MNKLKQIPEFSSETEERAFWETNDSTEYLDWSKAKTAKFAVQSLIKAWLVEDVEEQRRRT